jgi:hypothetical protein
LSEEQLKQLNEEKSAQKRNQRDNAKAKLSEEQMKEHLENSSAKKRNKAKEKLCARRRMRKFSRPRRRILICKRRRGKRKSKKDKISWLLSYKFTGENSHDI